MEVERLTAKWEKLHNDEVTQVKVLGTEIERFTEQLKEARTQNMELEKKIVVRLLEEEQKMFKLKSESEKNEIVEKYEKLELATELSNKTKDEQQRHYEVKCTALNEQLQLMSEKLRVEKQQNAKLYESLQQQNADLRQTLIENKTHIEQQQQEIVSLQQHGKEEENLISKLLSIVFESVFKGLQQTQNLEGSTCYAHALNIVQELRTILPQLEQAEQQPVNLSGLAVLMGQQFAQLQLQGANINSISADINTAKTVHEKIGAMVFSVEELCVTMSKTGVISKKPLVELCAQLEQLEAPLERLQQSAASKTDLGDLVVNELAEMDKSIAEATNRFVELLSQTRRKDEGIKLEVNGKILDACTALMECIKQLIERARQLQEEIVSIGRGSTSIKEFYKRNSQWSEGLISAAKSVARGANVLLDAADKATSVDEPVSREYFHILVAAQEIAAYTAQLVVASKVKAPKESERLSALQQASRSVSMATGAVVVTVRDCNKYLEIPEPIDITKLTSSQAKTMEMEIHVRLLELEQALQMQRLKLASFRRNNYQNTED